MTIARLRFAQGDPIEIPLDDVVSYGPEIPGFRAWLGAVNASSEGQFLIRFTDERLLGFRRDEIRRMRLTSDGAEVTIGEDPRVLPVREAEVVWYGPEPPGVRAWLGRIAHGTGEAWVRLGDGTELRFPMGDGPHVTFVERRTP
ncbi:MAG TPA: hypothetical protein VFA01_00360 [Candidatus Dormibacteraeota bacterium]|nr:hypothetical protein [Candidatus Dormibacteraeota bacterium]